MKIAVIGSTGFVGSNIINELVRINPEEITKELLNGRDLSAET